MKWFSILFLLLLTSNVVQAEEDINWDKLISAIIKIESNGNPNAVSEDGCIGLMQISLIVLTEYNITEGPYDGYNYFTPKDLYRPYLNKKIGTWYLKRLRDHYLKENYTIERLLSAWNAGITRLRRLNYDCSKMPKETRNFVKKVLKCYEQNPLHGDCLEVMKEIPKRRIK